MTKFTVHNDKEGHHEAYDCQDVIDSLKNCADNKWWKDCPGNKECPAIAENFTKAANVIESIRLPKKNGKPGELLKDPADIKQKCVNEWGYNFSTKKSNPPPNGTVFKFKTMQDGSCPIQPLSKQ